MATAGEYKAEITHPYLCKLPQGAHWFGTHLERKRRQIKYEVHKLIQSEIRAE
jgi:hypothetical protein